ncbi:MAG: type II toxin-antitoxin system RelE/ParE family toxin [Rickettsia endosymbiont of Pseudomimeciton antennatum]|nr:type II toxin-antitoxin system RelE/ParE family toxin [Rickettsia endosymbiont of Pseudomimeciton antennatum]MCC8398140.1 type II toxin-antitoxin system RelE/ParE family toxin [Rickettsia endosymbiont of Labidopullus appendiculatus]
MERLVWLESAITDLARLRKFIDKNNPNTAKRVVEVIKKAVIKLIEFPLIGKPVTNLIDYRNLYIQFGLSGYIYSNDLKNWNVKQGVSERSVVNLREYVNAPKFYGANSSKQKSILRYRIYDLAI